MENENKINNEGNTGNSKEVSYKTKFEIEVVKKIKAMRKALKITQTALAELLHVTRGRIGQIERINDASMYRIDQLNVIAKAFECLPKDFFPDYVIED